MELPFTFPDWMPWWLQLLLVVVGLLVLLALMLMPFSVFGLKSRLDDIEARLDEIQADLRRLALRLPEGGEAPEGGGLRAAEKLGGGGVPPIPPAAWAEPVRDTRSPTLRAAGRVSEAARMRAEPRLERPR